MESNAAIKFLKRYGIIILAVGVLGGILYLNRFSSVSNNERGRELYIQNCGNCHGEKGEGLRKLIPPLANSDYTKEYFNQIPCIIRYGIKGEISVNGQTFNQPMEGIPKLEADEIKSIMDYMQREWYKDLKQPSHAEVSKKLESCQ